MYLLKDKRAALKFSFLILGLITIVAIIVYAGGVFATTHTSTVEVNPDLVKAHIEYLFTATVTNTGGDAIHEFRIYWHGDFTSYDCQPVSGWDLYEITSGEEYYCQYVAQTSSDYITSGNSEDFTFYSTTPDECCRNFKFETRDPQEYYIYKYVEVCVDDTEPETTKTFDGPQKIEDGVEWIDGITKVVLTARDDVGPHDTGIEGTWYKNVLVEGLEEYLGVENCDSPCENQDICNNLKWFAGDEMSGAWVDYFDTGPFTKDEESCHILYYYSEDGVGNIEDADPDFAGDQPNINCFYVDLTPPLLEKDNGDAIPGTGEPMFMPNDNPNGDFHWLTTQMPITFTCDDTKDPTGAAQPHPSEGEKLCFKVSYDYPEWGYITDQYCTEIRGTMNDEGYCCEPVNPDTKKYAFYFQEESMHNLEYYCEDAVEKATEPEIQYYKVDDTPPSINKMIEGPQFGACPPEEGDKCWIADDDTHIIINAIDEGICAVDEVQCKWGYWLDGVFYGSWYPCDGPYCDITFPDETEHELHVICWDALGNEVEDVETFYVDSTGPTVKKEVDPPAYKEGNVEWIDTANTIELVATDDPDAPCGVGEDKIYYINSIDETENACLNPDPYCQSKNEPNPTGEGWTKYIGPFTKDESCHILEFYAIDKLGNIGPVGINCFFVDKTPPETTKTYEPEPYIDEQTDYKYIDTTHQIVLEADDVGPHPSGIDVTQYRVSGSLADRFCEPANCEAWMTMLRPDMGPWQTYTAPFGIDEESCHVIEYRSIDNVGKEEEIQWQCVFVDKTPPVIEKEYIGPYYNDSGIEYIDSETLVNITAYDPIPHPSGIAVLEYRVTQVGDEKCEDDASGCSTAEGSGDWISYTEPFGDIPESCHLIEIYAEDNVGKYSEHRQCVFVDKTAPVTEKWYDGPKYSDGLVDYSFAQTIPVSDGTVGNLVVTVTDEGDWMVWTFDFPVEQFTGDGNLNLGLIIATDGEGNGPAYQIHNNDGADSGYAWGTWLYSEYDNGWHSGTGGNNILVSGLSWVEATGNKNVPHGDGILQVKILKSELGGSFHWAASPTVGSGFDAPAYDVTMQIPSAFGWSNEIVEMTQPNYEYAKSVMGEYPHWITSETEVWLSATDDVGPHDSGVAATFYRDIYLENEEDWHYCSTDCESWDPTEPADPLNPEQEGWTKYVDPFTKSPESCHIIEYYSVDNVNKVEDIKWQCVFVDNTPPTPNKTVGEPSEVWDGKDAYFYDLEQFCLEEGKCWKVTSLTPITLDCNDPVPHPVDNERVCFKVELDGDDYTEEYCGEYGGDYNETGDGFCCTDDIIEEFYFLEDSEHNLDYYCVDALENKGPIDEEKFKVEGTIFEIPLYKKWNLISVPFVLLDDSPETVFNKTEHPEIMSVWNYDGAEWKVFYPDELAGLSTLEHIKPGDGYWVLVDCEIGEECEVDRLVLGGSLMQPRVMPPSKPLVPGWNLIGYYGTSWELYEFMDDKDFVCGDVFDFPEKYIYGDQAYCALNSLVDTQEGFPRWSSLWSYLNCGCHNDFWIGLNACPEQDLNRMYAGRGYWLEMDVADTYSPATTCVWNDDMQCIWTGGGIIP